MWFFSLGRKETLKSLRDTMYAYLNRLDRKLEELAVNIKKKERDEAKQKEDDEILEQKTLYAVFRVMEGIASKIVENPVYVVSLDGAQHEFTELKDAYDQLFKSSVYFSGFEVRSKGKGKVKWKEER